MNRSLEALGLTSEELGSLASQGFVSHESRGSNRCYFKLRFRHCGKQVVRSLGRDPATADEVRRELCELQAESAAKRELSRLHRESRRAMRRVKQSLAPLVHEFGLSYHGYSLRRRRNGHTASNTSFAASSLESSSAVSSSGGA